MDFSIAVFFSCIDLWRSAWCERSFLAPVSGLLVVVVAVERYHAIVDGHIYMFYMMCIDLIVTGIMYKASFVHKPI